MIKDQVNEALALLSEINLEGRIEYDDYSRLHDAIGVIGSDEK